MENRPLSADRPLLLWHETQAWRVTAGFADLFAVPVRDGRPAGRRLFLERRRHGEVLAPLPLAGGWGVLACGGQDALAEAAPAAAEDGAAVAALMRAAIEREAAQDAAIQARATQSRTMLEAGFDTLARVVETHRPAPPPADGGDPAVAVVRRVAAVLDRPVTAPAQDQSLPGPHGRVGAVLRASGLRARPVLLRDGWQRTEGLPLIARRADDDAPVALLPAAGGYVLWRPGAARDLPVTPDLAAELAPQALAVYGRFGGGALDARRLWQFCARGITTDLLRLAILALGTALLALAVPVATSLLVDEIVPAAARGQLIILVAGLAVAAVTTTCLELTKGLALLRLEGRLDSGLQAALFDRLLRLPAAFFKDFSAGDLTDRVLGVQAIREKLSGAAVTSLLGGIFSGISLIMLFSYSTRLALLAVALALVSAAVTLVLIWLQLRHERRQALVRGAVEGLVLQLITGIGKLAVAAARDRALAHWAHKYAAQKRHALAAQQAARLQAVFMAAFPPLANVAVFLTMAMLAKGDKPVALMEPGAFLAFNAALAQFLAGMTHAVRSLSDVLGAVPLWERARPLLAQPPEDGGSRHAPGTLAGGIEFAGIGFSYVSGGPSVLKGFSATVAPGEFVAVIGPSGSGKSTLMRLLLGLEQPSEGEVFFDGKPMSRLDLGQLRGQIGVVLQHSRILPGDVFHNIVGDSGQSLEAAWALAAQVGLDSDIRAMPMGMHTVLMDGAATLSGGQRQRLAIARALARRPRILLLDEATSALDNRTQAIVTRSLAGLGITRILIAHRLSTIVGVDRVLVMDQGRLVQAGRPDELAAQPGLFADMARRQTL